MVIKRTLSEVRLTLADVKAMNDGIFSYADLIQKGFFSIELTEDEKRAVYQEVQQRNMLKTAREKLAKRFSLDPYPEFDAEEDADAINFRRKMGRSYRDAVNPESKLYILNELVQLFWDEFDTSIPELTVWENALNKLIDFCEREQEDA